MAKKMDKGYKGYFYKDDGTGEVIGTMVSASLVSLILTPIVPPLGVVLDAITIPITIGTGVVMGTNLAINRNHSRKLFEAISNGDVKEIEERLNRINKKFDDNKKYILNSVRDENGNTLIASIIKSNIDTKTKKELIGKMIDNGANIASILEENNNGKTLIEEVAEKEGIGSVLLEFLAEKIKAKLNSREAKYKPILKKYGEKLEKYGEKVGNIEAEIKKREEEVKSGFHPFKRRAIRILKEELKRLKKEEKKMNKSIDTMKSKMEEKVTNKRTTLDRISNLNGNEKFVDKPMQIG